MIDPELSKAIGKVMSQHAALSSKLKNGSKSVFYGRDIPVAIEDAIPCVRYFVVSDTPDIGHLVPTNKIEIRVQIDVIGSSESSCASIYQLINTLMTRPGGVNQPIQCPGWRVDVSVPHSGDCQVLKSLNKESVPIVAVSRDWRMKALKVGQ